MTDFSQTTHRHLPRLIAWELTRTCRLNCRHCRAAAENKHYDNELSTGQCFRLLDNIAAFSKPIIILTGGEPMLRADLYDIATHGSSLGLRMVLATCGTLINDGSIRKIIDSGIQCISFSLDGATADSHDGFRRVPGAFDTVIAAAAATRRNGLPFQINTTIARHNLAELPRLLELSQELGAITFNPFLLVPTGRGKELADQELSAQQYEQTLQWLAECRDNSGIELRVTCAPHYQRIIRQNPNEQSHNNRSDCPGPKESHSYASGCMGGKTFAFVSHVGGVQLCGFLDLAAGDLRQNDFDFADIWKNSELFRQVRDVNSYRGKCGYCEYRSLCGGCRARAYALTGDHLASEPFCIYQPRKTGSM
ncbi:MAG: radical SAM protein [Sedimentisphaerales bacterium]|nr:radical SAM protein [Sedimentisphaerales bacterium]